MSRKYRHISDYSPDFKYRYNKKQRIVEAGKKINRRGRPYKKR